MHIEQINYDVVITRGEYTFTFGGCTLDQIQYWSIDDFFGCDSNEDISVILDLDEHEYYSILNQIRKQI